MSGDSIELSLAGPEKVIDGSGLLMLPALIDPHVHFRTPGGEHKEDWKTASMAAVRAGVTTVLDMPNNDPACTTYDNLQKKKKLIDAQLESIGIPLRYGLYFGADKNHFDEIKKAAFESCALKIFMGCSTGGLVIDDDESLDLAFRAAAEAGILVAVHAEDETILKEERRKFPQPGHARNHSLMRPKKAAIKATEKAINLAAKYKTPLYILHMSTKEELDLVRQAKKDGLRVYAEATTHHLFFTTSDYETLGTLVQMNPPIREKEDQEALWEALNDHTIDTIGTDHAPHTLAEKMLPFGQAPSGIPGIETLAPLLLDAVNRGKITLKRFVELTRTNAEKIFSLPSNDDIVLVDLNKEQVVEEKRLASKCGWTPYRGKKLRGWPAYTSLRGRIYAADRF